jgi:hypothetical protein
VNVQASFAEAGALIFGALLVVLAARRVLGHVLGQSGEASVVDTAMEPLAGVYGVLLAFLIGGVADRALQARAAVHAEAAAFHRVDRIAEQLPEPYGSEIRGALQTYAQLEKTSRAEGAAHENGERTLEDLWVSVATLEPVRARDGVLQSEVLEGLRTLEEQRLAAARAQRHAHGVLIWLVLGVGSLSVIAVCTLASLGDPRGPFYVAALTVVITISLYALWALSRPLTVSPFAAFSDLPLR